MAGAKLKLCAAAADADSLTTPRFTGLVDEAAVWVGANISVATAPAYLTSAMISPDTSSLGEPALMLHFNTGLGNATFSPAAAAAYQAGPHPKYFRISVCST